MKKMIFVIAILAVLSMCSSSYAQTMCPFGSSSGPDLSFMNAGGAVGMSFNDFKAAYNASGMCPISDSWLRDMYNRARQPLPKSIMDLPDSDPVKIEYNRQLAETARKMRNGETVTGNLTTLKYDNATGTYSITGSNGAVINQLAYDQNNRLITDATANVDPDDIRGDGTVSGASAARTTTGGDISDAQLAAMGVTREQYNKSLSVQGVTTSMSNENPVSTVTTSGTTTASGTASASTKVTSTAVSAGSTSEPASGTLCPFGDQTTSFNPLDAGNMSFNEYKDAYNASGLCPIDDEWMRMNYNNSRSSQAAVAKATSPENTAKLEAQMAEATSAIVNRNQNTSLSNANVLSLLSKNRFRSNLTPVYANRFSGTLLGGGNISSRFANMGSSFLSRSGGLTGINTSVFPRATSTSTSASRFGQYIY